MIHKFVANDNKGNVNVLEVTSTGTKLGKVAAPVEDTDAATKKYVDDNTGSCLPPVTVFDNGKVLTVENGAWAALDRIAVLYANVDPLTLAITADDDNCSYDEIKNKVNAGGYSFGVRLSITGTSITKYAYIQPEIQLDNAISFVGQLTNFDSIPIERWDIQFRVSESEGEGDIVFTGGMKQKGKYIVTLTPTSPDYSGTMDKTVAEINAAYEAGQEIWYKVGTEAQGYAYVPANQISLGNMTYPSFEATLLNPGVGLMCAYTGFTDDGTKQTYFCDIYALTPAS